MAPPFKEAEFDIMYGTGISKQSDILDLAVKEEIVIKSGAWFSYNDQKIGQGRDNTIQFLIANPDICLEIENKIREKYGLPDDLTDGDAFSNASNASDVSAAGVAGAVDEGSEEQEAKASKRGRKSKSEEEDQ